MLNSLLSLGAQVNDLWTASLLHSLAYPPSGSESPPSWTSCGATRKTQTVLPVLHSPAASKQGQRRVLPLRCPDAWRATPVLHSLAHRRSSSGLQPSPQGSAACREMYCSVLRPAGILSVLRHAGILTDFEWRGTRQPSTGRGVASLFFMECATERSETTPTISDFDHRVAAGGHHRRQQAPS